MRLRPLIVVLLGLLVLAGVWFFWPSGPRPAAHNNQPVAQSATPGAASRRPASTAPVLFAGKKSTNAPVAAARTNQFAWRLSNSSKSIGQLMNDPHAILLANAFIDAVSPLNLTIPKNLQSAGDPGAYIVQARGPVDNAFRAILAAAGAQIVSYIPNNAYLVRISSGGAAGLAGQPPVQSVIPYEPYYKISSALIGAAVQQKDLPENAGLTLGLFADNANATIDQIKNLGATVLATDRSPFGPIVRVVPPANWTVLATLPGVQIVELTHQRRPANDLARVTMGISADTVTPTNYMGLSGNKVLVEMNDTGVWADHPDFSATGTAETGASGSTRVFGLPGSLIDVNGHGTHVAGIIAGNGSASYSLTPTNEPEGSVTNADFRGKAPLAQVYSFAALDTAGNLNISDYDLQVVPATNNALISNNSWDYDDDTYDLAAASYDAAVRDALPLVTGSQPVLFVFSAGNDGGAGDDSGLGGVPDTILSPATAKDVITVGALEQLRYITNSVTNLDGSVTTPWQDGTDSANEVASYSARGNVGILTEGPYGRFKPDVVAPGSFVVSTRPPDSMWDQIAYYNPTNYDFNGFADQVVAPGTLTYYSLTIPANAVGVAFYIVPNSKSPLPFPANMPIYVSSSSFPTATVNDFMTANNQVQIPPDGGAGYINIIQNGGLNIAVGNTNSFAVNYDVVTEITTTNDLGNYFEVFSNMNETLSPNYRYESGTSMAAPAVTGLLALMQDYFTNILKATTAPSPALLKAMVINGARSQGTYSFAVTNFVNLQGWGLPDVTNSLPYGVTNQLSAPCASFFVDQSPGSALATGDSQTFLVNLETNINGLATLVQPLRVTLAWTDPPGNPAAALKLVNSLELVVTNLDDGTIYYGNDLDDGTPSYSAPWVTNTTPNIDMVNNVQNVFLQPLLGTRYSVTVIGRSVNVNAVTAQSNNVVQDFALVISSGDGEITNALTVLPGPANPFIGPQVTYIATTNSLLMNQFAGANTPLLGTNTVGAGPGYSTNAVITVGITNQWHFYVVTNVQDFTNAAFITFLSQTLATPRMGVYADPTQNPTQPEADIDLYVATYPDPNAAGLLNLDPNVISNCVNGIYGDAASLGNGTGTEFVAYTNSQPDQVYYIGVKSETQEAAEYDLLPVFSELPFSETDSNGNETVNGLLVPVNIPDGSPTHPGTAYVFALAVQPVTVQNVIVTNTFLSQNFGDLVGILQHSGKNVVLNNHNSPLPTIQPDIFDFIYDQSPAPVIGSQPPDGPGSLNSFQGQQGAGPWILNESDNSLTQTSSVTGLTIYIKPHVDLTGLGAIINLPPQSYFYGFVDVPAGATNLTIAATNITTVPDPAYPGELFEELGLQPTLTNYDKTATLTNGFPPGAVITVGPSDLPPIQPGRYYVTLYNPSPTQSQTYYVLATISLGQVAPVDFGASGPTNLLDDAVMYSSVFVTNTLPIATVGVGLRVDHPRISDLVFHLISPDGTRYLLMENRGGESTNGCGVTIYSTNVVNVASTGGSAANTNFVKVSEETGTLTINYNFYQVPDQMTVYASTNPADFSLASPTLILNTGLIPNGGVLNIPYTTTSGYLTIIMNQFGNPDTNTLWTYTAGGVQTNYYYLVLTEDTNLTTTPIKFAPPPFVPAGFYSTNFGLGDFESAAPGNYGMGTTVNGWSVLSNQVSVVNDPLNAAQGSQFLALANGVISNSIPTVPGGTYTLTYSYRGPGIMGWWRGENNANDSADGNSASAVQGIVYTTGEVGNAFQYNGSTSLITVPASTGLAVSNLTIESWVFPTDDNHISPIVDYGGAGQNANVQLWINTTGYGTVTYGAIHGVIRISGPTGALEVDDANPDVIVNQWNHLAFTVNTTSRTGVLYCNGVQVASATTPYPVNPQSFEPVNFGYRDQNSLEALSGARFVGNLDEVSIYDRPLSASEIKAIYTRGPLGKFDQVLFSSSPTLSLAEASVVIPGVPTGIVYGDNTNWQQQTISFTATSTSTPVLISGVEPGILLDAFNVSGAGGGGNLYYLPEQDLSPLNGTSAYGLWQLEIQDDRVGATNHTVLDSWQLQFVFANTNPVPANIGGGVTNFIPPGGLAWYEVDVPTNADFATNILTFATGPLNMWYSTNVPPTITNAPGDVELLAGQTFGSYLLGTNGYPNIIPGGLYYIGIQNPSLTQTVEYGFRVDFHLLTQPLTNPFAFTEPATSVTGTSAQLNGMATPNGAPATAWFEWGTNTLYGNTTPPVGVGAGFNVVYTFAPIPGLVTNVAYHFRLVVSNAQTVVYGFDQILDEAYVVAWGANYVGQANVPPSLSNNVVAIAGADDHSLALKQDGTALGWGDNTFGQATVPGGLSNLVAVAGGSYYSMALVNNGTVASWGANVLGQTNVPAGLNNVITIAGGTYASLALRSDGSVVAWGASFFNLTNVPVDLTNVVSVAGGSYHNLALKNDGTVTAWGDDSAGQTNVPADLTNVVGIAAGNYHSLALRYDGTVVSWGDDSAYQTNVPVGLSNVVAVAAGGFNSMALLADGTVVTWGDNTAGQSSVPVGLTNVVAISAGYLHSLALSPQSQASLTNIVLNLTNGVPQTNNISPGGVTYYKVSVPTNADFATNLLLYTINGPLNVWFTTNSPPTVGTGNDALLLAGVTNGASVLTTNVAPLLVPGATYYLGVQNLNSFTVNYGVEVNFHLVTSTNLPPTNSIPISGIIYTNIGGTNGFWLTWFAPSNDLFQVQWTTGLAPATWTTFTNPPAVSYNPNFPAGPTNAQFNFFDDGSQTGGFGPTRFYRIILLSSVPPSNTAPVLPPQAAQIINPLNPLVVVNTATDAESPPQVLTYTLTSTVTGTNPPVISANGIITWTPDVSQAGTSNLITTVVTDNGAPPLSATNSFAVIVNPVPGISSITYSNGGFLLTWWAPTNDIFEVQVATNLTSPTVWLTFSNLVAYTGPQTPTNGLFSFYDDGSEYPFGGLRFYQIILVGVALPANTPPVLPPQAAQIINPLNPLVVVNTATDAESPPQILTYALTSTVTGTNPPVISANGIITWTPDLSQAGTSNLITTVVTDNGAPPLSATNSFAVIVNPVPGISSVTYSNGGFLLTWWAPTNDIFEVQVATNLTSPTVWLTIATNVIYTGPLTPTNGLFSYYDDGSQVPFGSLRFYRLQLVGILPPATATVSISSILSTNGGFLLTWLAPTNDQFNVRWATSLVVPVNWTTFPDLITSTNGVFTFMDTNAPLLLKFYELILLP